ncbi:hypothetical protein [Nitrosomonas aestuarii]|uniref:hypothetical protein n=1 Tax=Nitrosomonas aestuarii TaxID=52441 RepID=UPI000D315091|nr:hypothetical protein [Nitrosomonas aestuarii]PTN08111.1 hypothetical protein C8R11_13018 [Nitrosomonas aestuarii]
MAYDDFCPFYERAFKNIRGGFMEKVLVSLLLGASILVIHYLSIGTVVFDEKGWILSIIITVASLSLFFATHTFRMLLPQLGQRLKPNERDKLIVSINNYLSDRKFLLGGMTFGFLNSLMGVLFGLPDIYDSILDKAVILGSYFIAGFICGVALSGIVGVTKCINSFSKNLEPIFDYTSQDKCGGTRFIGWALLIFSTVTLVVGVLITVYISITEWKYKSEVYVSILYASWILLPYIASIFVLLVPAISINKSLNRYKLDKEKKLSESIKLLFNELENKDISPERKSELYLDYQFQTNMRKELHEMRTWPFSIGTNSTYFLSVASSFYTTYESVNSWFPTPPPT